MCNGRQNVTPRTPDQVRAPPSRQGLARSRSGSPYRSGQWNSANQRRRVRRSQFVVKLGTILPPIRDISMTMIETAKRLPASSQSDRPNAPAWTITLAAHNKARAITTGRLRQLRPARISRGDQDGEAREEREIGSGSEKQGPVQAEPSDRDAAEEPQQDEQAERPALQREAPGQLGGAVEQELSHAAATKPNRSSCMCHGDGSERRRQRDNAAQHPEPYRHRNARPEPGGAARPGRVGWGA